MLRLSLCGWRSAEPLRMHAGSTGERFPARRLVARLLVLLVSAIGWHAADAAQARAWLDRNSMHLGETVTLNVEVTGDSSAHQPDFLVLANDFELLGTQNSSSVSIVNGQTTSKLLWAVGLEPRHVGKFTIPAFTIAGTKTAPLTVDVLPAPAGQVGSASDDVFVRVEATPLSPYVQQEVRLTVRLYYALSLIDGNLEDPKADGLVVRKLGQDSNYVADVDGRRYRVVERHYAISAEKSGTLRIPPIVFHGRGLDPNDMNSFFSRGRMVSAQSRPIALDVRARPPASGKDMWLPAQSLTLNLEGGRSDTSVRVGEPLTLTLRLKAQGLAFEQLPELKLPGIDGAEVYPDKETTQNRDDGSWIYGQRERKFAIVPQRAGSLTLPPISVAWWDTEHDRPQVAKIPSQTITVLPAQGARAPAPAALAPAAPAPTPASAPAAVPVPASPDLESRIWRWLALASIVLWLFTILVGIGLLRVRRARERAAAKIAARQPGAGSYNFRSACARGDLSAAARALLRRARRERPSLRNLGELARAVGDADQAALIAELERALYGSGAPPDATLARRLGDAFADGPIFAAPAEARKGDVLPALYPFELGKRA